MVKGARILVVEDSATQAEALAALLRANHYTAEIASDGDIALERIAHEHFDLVLSDVMMKRVSGYELTRRVRGELGRRDVPVVLLTSLHDPLAIIRGLECGADNYITKPYDEDQLLARIRNVLDRSKSRRASRSSTGAEISFLGSTFIIPSEKEQILDLLLSSVEDVVHAHQALQESQRQLATAHAELADAHAQLSDHAIHLERRERLSSEKYRILMHADLNGIVELDVGGNVLEANPQAGALFGVHPEALTGRSFETLFRDTEARVLRTRLGELCSVGTLELPELRIEPAGAEPRYCELRASTVEVAPGERLLLAVLRDVTERKIALDAVRESRDTLQALIDASPLAIIAVDVDGIVTLWNDAAERTFGWTAEGVLGHPLPFIPEDRAQQAAELRAALLAGRVEKLETVLRTRAGELIDVSLWAAQVRDEQDRIRSLVALLADTSERKALEQQLIQSQKLEAVGTLAGGIAHDFNNILTAISGYTELLLEDPRQPEDARADLRWIQQAASRATALTRQLLTFSRKQVLQPTVVDVNAVVAELEMMLRPLIREDIELIVETESNLANVLADAGQLQQVLLNLVINARDALPHGGRIRVTTANVTLGPDDVGRLPFPVPPGAYVAVFVEDNGIGMDESVREHIFEPFFSTKPKDKGTGLGLSIAYGIIKQSGGCMRVESEVGRGTTITI